MGLPVGHRRGRKRGGTAAAMLLAGTVLTLALPSAVLAFSSRFEPQPVAQPARVELAGFQPASVDPRLARSITVRALSKGKLFRFTPAATPSRFDRSVTVAVRLDTNSTRAIVVRGSLASLDSGAGLHIAPTAYSLGTTRGYKDFAQKLSTGGDARKLEIPDLASFKPSSGAKGDPARFSPRISLDDREKAGKSPRTYEGQDEARVDVGGSYSLTRNFDVTAGVRYQQERDRLVPLTDGKQDSQAVYVGTQFRF